MSIAFFEDADAFRKLSDAELIQSIRWRKKASNSLTAASEAGDVNGLARILQRRIEKLAAQSPVESFSQRYLSEWSLAAFNPTSSRQSLAQIIYPHSQELFSGAVTFKNRKARSSKKRHRINPRELSTWIQSARDKEPLTPFEQLVLSEVVAFHADQFDAEYFFELWRLLLESSLTLSAQQAEGENSELEQMDVSADQLAVLRAELPFRTGLIFRDIANSDQLWKQGRKQINAFVCSETDTDGVFEAQLYDRLPFWLAAVVRCEVWGKVFGKKIWFEDASDRLPDIFRRASVLCDASGGMQMCDWSMSADIVSSGARLFGLKKKSRERKFLDNLPTMHSESKSAKQSPKTKPRPAAKRKPKGEPVSYQSDWAEAACLRNDLRVDADTVLVRHNDTVPEFDLAALGVRLLSGNWTFNLILDGKPVTSDLGWSCSCWHSDSDGDYIEMQSQPQESVRIERQIFLSRSDHFAVFADAVVTRSDVRVELESGLPLPAETRGEHDVRTREIRLTASDLAARVFPLSLHQDRVQSVAGSQSVEADYVVTRQTAIGGLYAPVFVDWHPDRQSEDAVWRQLTVTEARRVVTRDEAASYRMQIGSRQWFVFRNMKTDGIPRCALGHHTGHETVIGRFTAKGLVLPLVVVDGDTE